MTKSEKFFTDTKVVVLLAILCNCLWGSAIPAIKVGYKCFDITNSVSTKILFAGVRFLIAGIVVLLFYWIIQREFPIIQKKNVPAVLALGLVQTTIQYIFFYIGVSNAAAANGSIVNSMATFMSVVLAHFIYKNDKLNANKIIGCIVGFIGVLIVIVGNGNGASADVSFMGEGFVIIAALAFSISGVMSKYITNSENSIITSGYNLAFGGVVLIVIGLVFGGKLTQVTTQGILVLLYLALLSSVAFAVWTILLKYNAVGKICIYNFVVPVAGLFIAGLVLDENIWQGKYFVALILVSIGIVIVNMTKKKV